MESTNALHTKWKLGEWGKWHHYQSGAVRGYPHAIPTEQLRGSSVKSATTTDDENMAVDGAVSELGMREPELKSVLVAYYLEREDLTAIARNMGIGRTRATEMLNQACKLVEWILGG